MAQDSSSDIVLLSTHIQEVQKVIATKFQLAVKEENPLTPLWSKIDKILAKHNKDYTSGSKSSSNNTTHVGKSVSEPETKTSDDEKGRDVHDKKKPKWIKELDHLLGQIDFKKESKKEKEKLLPELEQVASGMFGYWTKVT